MRYIPDFYGAEAWLRGPEATAVARFKAEQLKAQARAIAPVGNPPDPHPGAYRDSIEVGEPYESQGRVTVPVGSPLAYAAAVELDYGYHTLARAADKVNDPSPTHRRVPSYPSGRTRTASSGLSRQHSAAKGRYTSGYLVRRLLPGSSPFKSAFYLPTRPSLRRLLSPRGGGGVGMGIGVGGLGGLSLTAGSGGAVSTYAGGAPPPAAGQQPPPAQQQPTTSGRLRRKRRLRGQVGAAPVAGLQGSIRRRVV